jgi:hypothetical protein
MELPLSSFQFYYVVCPFNPDLWRINGAKSLRSYSPTNINRLKLRNGLSTQKKKEQIPHGPLVQQEWYHHLHSILQRCGNTVAIRPATLFGYVHG